MDRQEGANSEHRDPCEPDLANCRKAEKGDMRAPACLGAAMSASANSGHDAVFVKLAIDLELIWTLVD